MLAWSIALLLIAGCATVGFYMGAVRVGITTIFLLLGLFFLKPLTALGAKVLPMLGVSHPGMQIVLGALLAFLLIQIIAKSIARGIQPSLEKYFKYDATDTQRLLFERLDQRVGPTLGIVNAFLYFVFVSIAGLGLGYASVQFSRGPQRDGFIQNGINGLARSLQSGGMGKVVGSYIPATPLYYGIVDVAAEWFHQPLVQSRLATYPAFITLSERPEFQSIGADVGLQEFLIKSPTIGEIYDNAKLNKFITEWPILERALVAVGYDLTDVTEYVRTGKSDKYDSEKILGRWDFNLPGTVAENKKLRRMSGLEVNKMLGILNSRVTGAQMLATPDGKLIIIRLPPGGTQTRLDGTWKSQGGGKYTLNYPLGDDKMQDFTADVDGRKLSASLNNYPILFERW